jgi:undecaprenyl-diphosphatase
LDLDATLVYDINGLAGRSGILDYIMLHASYLATFYIPILAGVGYWIWRQRWTGVLGSLSLLTVVYLADAIARYMRLAFGRVRPCNQLAALEQLGTLCGGSFSFPSGHAVNTAAAAAFMQVLYPKTGWITWPVIAIVGFSRVYIGAHYVSDVLGSWVIGAAIGVGSAMLFKRFMTIRHALPARRGMLLILMAGMLVACTSVYEYKTVPGEAALSAPAEGNAVVAGRVILKTPEEEIKKGADSTVYLVPVTDYSKEWFEHYVLKSGRVRGKDPRAFRSTLATVTDQEGRFEFRKVAPGEYYLICTLLNTKPGFRMGRLNFALRTARTAVAYAMVNVDSEQRIDVTVTRSDT